MRAHTRKTRWNCNQSILIGLDLKFRYVLIVFPFNSVFTLVRCLVMTEVKKIHFFGNA